LLAAAAAATIASGSIPEFTNHFSWLHPLILPTVAAGDALRLAAKAHGNSARHVVHPEFDASKESRAKYKRSAGKDAGARIRTRQARPVNAGKVCGATAGPRAACVCLLRQPAHWWRLICMRAQIYPQTGNDGHNNGGVSAPREANGGGRGPGRVSAGDAENSGTPAPLPPAGPYSPSHFELLAWF